MRDVTRRFSFHYYQLDSCRGRINKKPRQSTRALKLKLWISHNSTVGREEYVGGHPLGAESTLKAVKGGRFEAADKQPTTMVERKEDRPKNYFFPLSIPATRWL